MLQRGLHFPGCSVLVPLIPKEDFCGSERDDMPLKREGEMILSTLMLLTHLRLQGFLFVHQPAHRLLTAVVRSVVLTSDPVPLLALTLLTPLVHEMTFSLLIIIILILQLLQVLLLLTIAISNKTAAVTHAPNSSLSVCTCCSEGQNH